ncbi:MAG: hypothetical protein WB767_02455 [Nocardioides sp.]
MSTTPDPPDEPTWAPEPSTSDVEPTWPAYQPPAESTPPPVPYGAGGYAPVPDAPHFPQAHSGANLSMWLGIGSIASSLGAFACFLTIPAVVIGPIAVVQAVRANREIEASPGRYSNSSAATTGLITGIIGTAVGLLMLVFLVISVAGSFD